MMDERYGMIFEILFEIFFWKIQDQKPRFQGTLAVDPVTGTLNKTPVGLSRILYTQSMNLFSTAIDFTDKPKL